MNDHETIRVGLIGAGGNTREKHIPGLQAMPGVEIVSVCNRSVESGRRVAGQFGIPQVHTDWMAIIEDESVDAVVIGTWPYMHCPMTCLALEAGKHVLVEARMAMNAGEARLMLQTSRCCPQSVAQVVPSPLTFRFDRTLSDLIAEGFAGDPYAIELHGEGNAFADPLAPMSWRQDFELSGLNTLNLGIWYEALARWIGHARRVTAMRKVCVRQRPHPQGGCAAIRVPDHVDVLAEMDCGAQAHLRFSAVTGLFDKNRAGVWIYGSEGTLWLDLAGNRLMGGRRGDKTLREIPVPPEKAGGWRVEESFVNAIRGLEPVTLTDFAEGLRYMEFTEAVAVSAERGQTVSLPLIP